MWRITEANRFDDKNGELLLHHLDNTGNPTTERMLLPVTIDPDYKWADTPSNFDDTEVIELLEDLIFALLN